jgi:hypothetical protein
MDQLSTIPMTFAVLQNCAEYVDRNLDECVEAFRLARTAMLHGQQVPGFIRATLRVAVPSLLREVDRYDTAWLIAEHTVPAVLADPDADCWDALWALEGHGAYLTRSAWSGATRITKAR